MCPHLEEPPHHLGGGQREGGVMGSHEEEARVTPRHRGVPNEQALFHAGHKPSCFTASRSRMLCHWRRSGSWPEGQVHCGPELARLTVGFSLLCRRQAGAGFPSWCPRQWPKSSWVCAPRRQRPWSRLSPGRQLRTLPSLSVDCSQ